MYTYLPKVLSALLYVLLQAVGQACDEGLEMGLLQRFPHL